MSIVRLPAPPAVGIKSFFVQSPVRMMALLADDFSYVMFEAVVYGHRYWICGVPDPEEMRKRSSAMARIPKLGFTYMHAAILNRFISKVLAGVPR